MESISSLNKFKKFEAKRTIENNNVLKINSIVKPVENFLHY